MWVRVDLALSLWLSAEFGAECCIGKVRIYAHSD